MYVGESIKPSNLIYYIIKLKAFGPNKKQVNYGEVRSWSESGF